MTPRNIQLCLAVVFLGLGGWALLMPDMVQRLVLTPDHYIGTAASNMLMGCFGAQAVLCGVLIATTRFSARTFLTFGIVGSVPFFVFNFYFVFVAKMFTNWMLLDFVGNIAILALCLTGYRLTKQQDANTR
jgi:hypothetical protein